MQEEKQPPSLRMFPGLEDAVEAEPLALAHHMNLYAREAFADFSREFIHNKVLMRVDDKDPLWVRDKDPAPLPRCILTDFSIGLTNYKFLEEFLEDFLVTRYSQTTSSI